MPDADKIDALVRAFANAHHNPEQKVRASELAGLSLAEALAIQGRVLRLLGQHADVAKVSLTGEGGALAAPIPANMVVRSGAAMNIGRRDLVGLEIEIAAVLGADVTPALARAGNDAVREAIDHYVLGIELIGSRIDDRLQAGPFGPLADWMITGGYVLGVDRFDREPAIDGLPVQLSVDGVGTQREQARHPFGNAVAPIAAAAVAASDGFGGLRKGMTVTTGSLSPLLLPREGSVEIRIGDLPPVAFTLRRDWP